MSQGQTWGLALLAAALVLSACASAAPATIAPQPTPTQSAQQIAYQATQTDETDTIWIAGERGAGAHVLMPDVPGLNQEKPDWSPDGTQIVFVNEAASGPGKDIWVADSAGADPHVLYDSPAAMPWAEFPAWSRDGERVVAVINSDEPNFSVVKRSALVIIDVATGEAEEIVALEDKHEILAYPRWSPDGEALVVSIGIFSSDESMLAGESLAVITHTPSGWSEPEQITPPDKWASYPDWHPTQPLLVFATADVWFMHIVDNSHLAVSERPDTRNLFTIHADGSSLTPVTTYTSEAGGQPSWTLDGRIIFTHNGVGNQPPHAAYIYADGSGQFITPLIATHSRLQPQP